MTVTYQMTCASMVGTYDLTVGSEIDGGITGSTWPVSVVLPAAPMPTIKLGGNAISGMQSVVVGQQIALSSTPPLPPCMSISSQQWSTPPGTAIGSGYAPTTATGPEPPVLPANNTSTYTFYWVYAGSSLSETYQYAMAGGGSSVSSPVAAATFTVQSVSSPTMAVQNYGAMSIDNLTGCSSQGGGPYLVFGNVAGPAPGCSGTTTGTAGVKFTEGGTQPGSGNFSFVQLITSDTTTDTGSSGNYTCTYSAGVDGVYPYGGHQNATYATDAPEAPLPSTYNSVSRSFNATMYLLWKSTTLNSIPVPLGYQNWQFSGSANQSGGSWTASGSGGPAGGFIAATGSQAFKGFPTWSGAATASCH